MQATWRYRISALAFVLFALGQASAFDYQAADGGGRRRVMDAMERVHFTVRGTSFS